MVNITLDEAGVQEALDSFDIWRDKIIEAARGGMQEAMENAATAIVADKLGGSPVQSRTGALAKAIDCGARTFQSGDTIYGTISSDVGGKHVGTWLEFGTHVKQVLGKMMAFQADEDAAPWAGRFAQDSGTVFSRGHKAFDVAARPFLRDGFSQQQETLMATIRAHIQGATGASVDTF